MKTFEEILDPGIRTIGIAGHVNPDGDCVGSSTAVRLYLQRIGSFDRIDLYLEPPKDTLCFLEGVKESLAECDPEIVYDLFICCDVSEEARIGVAAESFARAKKTVCIDHHISNPGFADINHVVPEASSTAEVLADLFDMEKVDLRTAECLYTGIIHDTGVFQYRNTLPHTMRVAALLMEKGVEFNRIINESFNRQTYLQGRALGYCLQKTRPELGGRCFTTWISLAEMAELEAVKSDFDSVVAQLRVMDGCEAAVFAYETSPGVYKVSLRGSEQVDVSKVASVFGGGGHVQAAGCTIPGRPEEVLSKIVGEIRKRLDEME